VKAISKTLKLKVERIIMKSLYRSLCTLIVIIFIASCSGTVSSVDKKGQGAGHMYAISDVLAKRLMLSAMKAEFSEGTIKELTDSRLGYHSTVDWGGDTDKIELVAIPALGTNKSGNEVKGFVFSAKHSGTAPAAGGPTVDRLITHLISDAEKLGVSASFKGQ